VRAALRHRWLVQRLVDRRTRRNAAKVAQAIELADAHAGHADAVLGVAAEAVAERAPV
jgi:hypothetical protein